MGEANQRVQPRRLAHSPKHEAHHHRPNGLHKEPQRLEPIRQPNQIAQLIDWPAHLTQIPHRQQEHSLVAAYFTGHYFYAIVYIGERE